MNSAKVVHEVCSEKHLVKCEHSKKPRNEGGISKIGFDTAQYETPKNRTIQKAPDSVKISPKLTQRPVSSTGPLSRMPLPLHSLDCGRSRHPAGNPRRGARQRSPAGTPAGGGKTGEKWVQRRRPATRAASSRLAVFSAFEVIVPSLATIIPKEAIVPQVKQL